MVKRRFLFLPRGIDDVKPQRNLQSIIDRVTNSQHMYTQYTKERFKPLTDNLRLLCFNRDPRIRKGIIKKCTNLFSRWFKVDSPIDGVDVPDSIEQKITSWNKTEQLKKKLTQHYINQLVFGRAYLELSTVEIIGEHGEGLEKPFKTINNTLHVYNVDPRVIQLNTVKNKEAQSVNRYQKPLPDTDYFVMRDGKKQMLVHPSRILMTSEWTAGDSTPVGVIDVAYNLIESSVNSDRSLGEILYRFGHPFPTAIVKDASDEELDAVQTAFGKIGSSTGFVGDDRYTFNLLNPSAVNPKEFAEYFYIGLACALNMPVMVLLGVQKGAVTGSEIDLSDYYNDLHSIQETLFTPMLNTIYKTLLGSWDYEIFWNPIFVNEESESKIRKTNMEALKLLYFDMGIIDDVTARQIAREWGIPIPEEYQLETEETPMEEEQSKTVEIRKPTKWELEWAEYYKRLGEKELIEQEKRLENAKKRPNTD